MNMHRGQKPNSVFEEQKNNHLIGSSVGFTQRGNTSAVGKSWNQFLWSVPTSGPVQSSVGKRIHGRILNREVV